MHTAFFRHLHNATSLSCALFTLVLLLPAVGQAQDGKARRPGANDDTVLERVTVSATGSGSAGHTPFSAKTMEERRLKTVEDVLNATPGIAINSWGGNHLSTTYVRGVGGMYPMNMDDSLLSFSVNGSSMNARYLRLGTLDLDSIDVLKGPQGTQSSASASAGLVSMTPRLPSQEFDGYIGSELGTGRQHTVEGAIGGGLTEDLSGRFAMRYSGENHWIDRLADGEPISKPSDFAVRGSLLWDIDDATSALLTLERQDSRAWPTLLVLRPYPDQPVLDLPAGFYNDVRQTIDRAALKLSHDFPTSRITSTSSFYHAKSNEALVYDKALMAALYHSPSLYWRQEKPDEHVFDQDLRWSSLEGERLEWALGLFAEHADRSYDSCSFGRYCTAFRDFDTDRYGLYGNTVLPLTDRLKLDAGLRYERSRTRFDATYHGSAGISTDSRELTEDALTGKLGLTYALTPDLEIHARVARGFKPGGFNVYSTQIAEGSPFRGATTDSVEAGFDAEFAAGLFSLSGAAYLNRVEDNHLLSYDSKTFLVSALNADTRAKGVDLSAGWHPGNGFDLTAGLSYVDADIRSSIFGIGDGDVLTGNKVPDAASWSATASLSYTRDLEPMLGMTEPQLITRIDYRYVGKRPADPQNHFDLDGYHKLDARIALAEGKTEFYLRGENLLDEKYDLYAYDAPASGVRYGAMVRGRAVMAGVTRKF
ncbi:TonB-dependent receptor [Rhizobium sp. SSA_523]|uniref:TonB-dependent receptor n=1 Tax=Rhizobium sp. SSA_523 TaxID=2952477 RepID=UPI0020900951|nr:TonB-dependent receptor [Rhizobium sp. SSA_523]MCO5731254.1 TonB-dependent receptor [Rhizobium sp. SSA_523]WKC22208.1 TonB-dependent receptor [Rhizobium sp. SSA_523]